MSSSSSMPKIGISLLITAGLMVSAWVMSGCDRPQPMEQPQFEQTPAPAPAPAPEEPEAEAEPQAAPPAAWGE